MEPCRKKRSDILEKLRELKKSVKETFDVVKYNRQKRKDILEKLRELNKPEVNNNATNVAAAAQERSKPENHKPRMGLGNKMTVQNDFKHSKRNKDTIDINILSSNVRSFNNKKVSIENILNSKSVDIGVFSEINTKRVPKFKGFTSFTKYSKKRFHGVSIYVNNNIASRVLRIPDESQIECVHLIIRGTNPLCNIIGIYLNVESRTTTNEVSETWAKLMDKVAHIVGRGESLALVGDFNRPLDAAKPSFGTKLLKEWINEGSVTLLNSQKMEPTRIDPCTNKGSILDLGIVSSNIKSCVRSFNVDTKREFTPFSMIKKGGNIVKKETDHSSLFIEMTIPSQAEVRAKKVPVINFNNKAGWNKYPDVSNKYSDTIMKTVAETEDINALETKLDIIDNDILIECFGLTWKKVGGSSNNKKRKKKSHKELKELFLDQQRQTDTLISSGLQGKDLNKKVQRMKQIINGPKVKQAEPQAINDPQTGDLITEISEIKRVSLEHNVRILTKNKPREKDLEEIKAKEDRHEKIMKKDDKEGWELDHTLFSKVLEKIKTKNKNYFRFLNNAGIAYKEAMFQYMSKMIKTENIPKCYLNTSLFQIWKGKGSALDLNQMRFIHMRSWRSKLIEALVTEKMKPKIVKATPNIQIGGMPKASSSEHLLVLKTWMKLKEDNKEGGIFNTYDMEKFFDKESLTDCMDSLSQEAKVDNKSYRLWYKLNQNAKISVKTSVGESESKSISDSIGQGSMGAALVSSLNIGCSMKNTFKEEHSTKIGDKGLNNVIYQDDVGKLNDKVEQSRVGCAKIDDTLKRKKLSINYGKSKFLVMGNTYFRNKTLKEFKKNPLKMGDAIIEHSEMEKYLGDIIHEKGCKESIAQTIKDRIGKATGVNNDIIQTCDSPWINGLGNSSIIIKEFEARVIPLLLNNCETWIGISDKQIEELQEFQEKFLISAFRLANTTTRALINWDTKMKPMRWRIAEKKLQFLRKLMEKEYSCLAKQIIYQEVIHGIKGLASECKSLSKMIGLPNLVLSTVTKQEIKSSIKIQVENELKTAMEEKVKVRDRLSEDPENDDDNNYINRIPVPLARVWLRYRGRAIAGVKGNFKKSWPDLSCRYCDLGVNEEQEHLEECVGTEYERRGLDLQKWRQKLTFWTRMNAKIAAATLKKGPVTS